MGHRLLWMPDAHVKARTWTNDSGVTGDAYAALDRVLRLTGRPDTLLIGGDWFDSNRPSSEDMVRSSAFIRSFGRVYLIRGNHDSAEPHWLESDDVALGGRVRSLDCPDAFPVLLGTATMLAGLHWSPSRNALLGALAKVRDRFVSSKALRLILMTHAPFRHLLGFDGSWQLCEEDIDSVFAGLEVLVLAGDIHVQDDTVTKGGVRICSGGSLYPLSTADLGEHAVTFVDADTLECTRHPVQTRQYASVDWTTPEALALDARSLTGLVGEENGYPLPPVLFVRCPAGEEPPPEALRQDGVVVRVVHAGDDAQDVAAEARRSDDGMTMADALREELPDDTDLQEMGVALLASDDPLAMVSGWLDTWGVERIQ